MKQRDLVSDCWFRAILRHPARTWSVPILGREFFVNLTLPENWRKSPEIFKKLWKYWLQRENDNLQFSFERTLPFPV